jgi:hypothetical protein
MPDRALNLEVNPSGNNVILHSIDSMVLFGLEHSRINDNFALLGKARCNLSIPYLERAILVRIPNWRKYECNLHLTPILPSRQQ